MMKIPEFSIYFSKSIDFVRVWIYSISCYFCVYCQSSIRMCHCKACSGTVSYTHLDVYKRQIHDRYYLHESYYTDSILIIKSGKGIDLFMTISVSK